MWRNLSANTWQSLSILLTSLVLLQDSAKFLKSSCPWRKTHRAEAALLCIPFWILVLPANIHKDLSGKTQGCKSTSRLSMNHEGGPGTSIPNGASARVLGRILASSCLCEQSFLKQEVDLRDELASLQLIEEEAPTHHHVRTQYSSHSEVSTPYSGSPDPWTLYSAPSISTWPIIDLLHDEFLHVHDSLSFSLNHTSSPDQPCA